MKKWIKGLMVVSLSALFLGGCGNSSSKNDSDSDNKLKVLLSEEPSKDNALIKMLDKWAEETDNKVETIVIPYDDQLTKFPLMLKNKDVPDMVMTTRLTRLYPDEFEDLSKEIDTSLFDPFALEIIGQDYSGTNRSLALPIQYTITCYFYNQDAFEKANIEVPTEENPWTLDELYKNSEKLQKDGGVKYGLAVDFSRARYDNFMYMNGGSITQKTSDSFEVTVNSETNIKTLEQFVEMNQKNVLPKVIWSGGSTDNPADYFKNGDVGIYLSGTWNYNQLSSDIKEFEFGVMPSPKGSVTRSVIAGGDGLAIPADAKNKKLSTDFMKWFYLNEKNYQEYLEADKGISFMKDGQYSPKDEKVANDYKVLQEETNYVTEAFLIDESSGWRNYLDNEYRDDLKQAVNEDLTSKAALDDFAKGLSEKSGWKIAK